MLRLLIVLVAVSSVWGSCPDVPENGDFDLGKFLGEWNAISLLRAHEMEPTLDCVKMTITVKDAASLFANVSGLYRSGVKFDAVATAIITDSEETSRMIVDWMGVPQHVTVVLSDYKTFGLVSTCAYLPDGQSSRHVLILSRSIELSEKNLEMLEILATEKLGLDQNLLYRLEHVAKC